MRKLLLEQLLGQLNMLISQPPPLLSTWMQLPCCFLVSSSMGCLSYPSTSGLHLTYCSAQSLPESWCSMRITNMHLCQYTAAGQTKLVCLYDKQRERCQVADPNPLDSLTSFCSAPLRVWFIYPFIQSIGLQMIRVGTSLPFSSG